MDSRRWKYYRRNQIWGWPTWDSLLEPCPVLLSVFETTEGLEQVWFSSATFATPNSFCISWLELCSLLWKTLQSELEACISNQTDSWLAGWVEKDISKEKDIAIGFIKYHWLDVFGLSLLSYLVLLQHPVGFKDMWGGTFIEFKSSSPTSDRRVRKYLIGLTLGLPESLCKFGVLRAC